VIGAHVGSALKALGAIAFATLAATDAAWATAATSGRPNILVIFGDDVGYANLSSYNPGVMGYTTPNIDRIGREGVMFSDHYAQPSCTAGRAAFITGQYPIRSGLTTVGRCSLRSPR
jgi:arylsulfatase A-like enzyme